MSAKNLRMWYSGFSGMTESHGESIIERPSILDNCSEHLFFFCIFEILVLNYNYLDK